MLNAAERHGTQADRDASASSPHDQFVTDHRARTLAKIYFQKM